eukprot:11152537-Alexandrium_andersonii.AAC.1
MDYDFEPLPASTPQGHSDTNTSKPVIANMRGHPHAHAHACTHTRTHDTHTHTHTPVCFPIHARANTNGARAPRFFAEAAAAATQGGRPGGRNRSASSG